APVEIEKSRFTIVDTGDSLPDGMNAVIMVEDIIEQGDKIRLIAPAVPWQHVRQIGEDFSAGDMLACSGTVLTPALLGALVAGGVAQVSVVRQPLIILIPTGDEIVPPTDEPAPGLIPDFNSTVYGKQLEADGALVEVMPIIPDVPELIQNALAAALVRADLVMLLAGSSAGRDDLSTQVIESQGEVILHGIAIRPGKPTILGLCEPRSVSGRIQQQKPVIGLPGYSVSGLIVLEEIVRPLLRQVYQLEIDDRLCVEARLSRRLVSSLKYREYIRVRLTRSEGQLIASPLERGAGILTSFAKADGLLVVPRDSEGFDEGSTVTVRLLRPMSRIEQALSVIGSHDPLLDEMADLMVQLKRPATAGATLSSIHAGSMGGILAVRRHEAQIAGIHLLDEKTGDYNIAYVQRFFPAGNVLLIEGVRRQQGLLVQRGNPLQIKDLADIAERQLRYVNRQKGAGTRLLLDYHLAKAGYAPEQLSGYSREEYTHTGVAAQIASGSADAGLAILSVARMSGLDFLPLAEENYDFLIDAKAWELPSVQQFIAVLQSEAFRQRLEQLGGYRLEQPGRIIMGPGPLA
ncbi:MAG: Molybdenum cofactor synthesis domain protein, partial [Firmicutes bacterium]|nr:Molybdenum cofactor synthesis domain protein [Bacillota bacterium]